MRRWLILDTHFLCWRSFYALGNLSHDGSATGVTFGFLQSIRHLKDEFGTDDVVFCFEHPTLHRRKLFAEYKMSRAAAERTLPKKDQVARFEFRTQVAKLRLHWLPMIGFKNIFCVEGMESDDLMASIAANAPGTEEVVLVTGDSDLWQCLKFNVSVYDPVRVRLMTYERFKKDRGYEPMDWARVKARSGCNSDGVPGVPGVGEITAQKDITGVLGKKTAAYNLLHSDEGRSIIKKNLALVRLPFEGCPNLYPLLKQDAVNDLKWKQVCSELGFRSIRHKPPVASRKQMRLKL